MNYKSSILVLAALFFLYTAKADDWTVHASYHKASKAVKAGTRIFVLANGNLLSCDTDDQYVELYDKTNALSDFGIADIAYSSTTHKLVVLYSNGNVDLIGTNNTCWNMPDLKNKSLSDKTINELKVADDEALVSLNAGLAIINLQKGYFVNFYDFGTPVLQATSQQGFFYIKTAKGVKKGARSQNLQDIGNWTAADAETVHFGPTADEKTEAEALLQKVKDFTPNSPLRNWAYQLNMQGSRLLVAGGNFYYPEVEYTGYAGLYEDGRWTAFDEEGPIALVGASAYHNVTDVVQDPTDPNHHWLGTKRSGIYEFRNLKMVAHYGHGNSPLTSILPNDRYPNHYVRTTALAYDSQGNLWMCHNQNDTIVRILTKDRRWLGYYYGEVAKRPTWDHTVFDKRGWAWIVCRRTTEQGESGLLVIDTHGTIDNRNDDRHRFLSAFNNQNGEGYSPDLYYCVTEDLNGTLWIGCSSGLFITAAPENIFNSNFTLTQPIVPRNDGSGLGDYLLANVPVKCVAIDGGNRKWVGTVNNGVYLLSSDGMETIQHFTVGNSPLISDNINDIAIDGKSGEVFIATDLGLCSYHGDATDPAVSMNSDLLKVFPNPVRPDYQGSVHITGLMRDSDVKIVSASGRLVAQGKSVGGEYSWNRLHADGSAASSGIYYALCTDEQGNHGACAKILLIK